jgi:cell division protein FtsL
MNNKENFIKEYETKSELKRQRINRVRKRTRNKFTMRNVLATIFLIVGITLAISYILSYISYSKYNVQYTNFKTSMDTLGITSTEQNTMLKQFGVDSGHMDWVKVYKTISIYIAGASGISFLLSIILWGFLPNFKFSSIFKIFKKRSVKNQ